MTAAASAVDRVELLGLPFARLSTALEPIADRPFRIRQIYDAMYRRGVTDFGDMTELSRELRRALAERYSITLPEVIDRRLAIDGTTKLLLRLADGASIEAVDIPERTRRTLCISSQAGCGLACAFCVTGFWGAGRNLTAGEIVAEVLLARSLLDLPPTLNLVFMGMGEPLLNLGAVRDALEVLGPTISPRRVTLSTAGVVPGIDELGRWPRRPNLAISLHATDDDRRSRIMPINNSYPLDELFAALRRYPLEPRRRITFEYLLIEGFNDDLRDADALAGRLAGVPAKVNLIPLNPDPVLPEWMRRPSDQSVERFRERVAHHRLTTTVRKQRGHDVAAACGQLRASDRAPRGAPSRHR